MPWIVISGGADNLADTLEDMRRGREHPYTDDNKTDNNGKPRFSGNGVGRRGNGLPRQATSRNVEELPAPGNYLIEYTT